MRFCYMFSCLSLLAVVMAIPKPTVFMGLQQQNQRALPLNAHAVKPHIYQQLPQEHSFSSFDAPPTDLVAPAFTDTFASAIHETNTANMLPEDSYNAAYRHSSSQQHQTGYNNKLWESQVHKHIYVHVPPKDFEEDDAIQPKLTHQGGPKQKHYKIIFIKAPMAPAIRTPIAPPPPQVEEKTLIYVLHKKPESQPDIIIPTPEPTKPSKPEVYFIKYKPKRDEAPVYGPPALANEIKSRQSDHNEVHDFVSMDLGQQETVASTQQPQYQRLEQNPQPSVLTNEHLSGPTQTNLMGEEVQATTSESFNQYLPPETTIAPIVVKSLEEPIHAPVATYGPPNRSRYFIKKRK